MHVPPEKHTFGAKLSRFLVGTRPSLPGGG